MVILLLSLAILLILGIPIAYAIGLSSLFFFALNHPDLVQILPQRMFAGFNSYTLIALPLFILMGFLMNEAGITAKLINFCQLFVGRFRGRARARQRRRLHDLRGDLRLLDLGHGVGGIDLDSRDGAPRL